MGGQSSPCPGRVSQERLRKHLLHSRARSEWQRSPRPRRGPYRPNRPGALWEMRVTTAPQAKPFFSSDELEYLKPRGLRKGSRRVASGCVPLAPGGRGRKWSGARSAGRCVHRAPWRPQVLWEAKRRLGAWARAGGAAGQRRARVRPPSRRRSPARGGGAGRGAGARLSPASRLPPPARGGS